MSGKALTDSNLRERIIADPGVILEDRDLMKALVAANERSMGANVIDLRGIAMERLEARLERLEDTHRTVIAAAYDNLAGTNQIHRAVLQLLEPADFTTFLTSLGSEIADTLRVSGIRLVLESTAGSGEDFLNQLSGTLAIAEPDFVDSYISRGRRITPRMVTLRQVQAASPFLYDDAAEWIRSEALIRLDLGEGRLPGLLAMASEDPHQFAPSQGTDLLGFFGGVFQQCMRRWLS